MNIAKSSKLLIVLLSVLLVADLGATEVKELRFSGGIANVRTVCIEGYLFAVVVSMRGVAITQMYNKIASSQKYPAQPITCKSN